ncbi:PEP/pyruvate-binding domain-containing protein [Roseinatronobacter sp.]|uniref:PEP/pyruvate-binding domain-containing protein n=1 Tax=Roseinatronobacter sp. TaxID=1945755 RepID=UPI0025DA5E49|nr:PEP/pyruvate-binding domain-containing protein [Roseibaca sp.]
MTAFTLPFEQIGTKDHARVGGKCASLGEMTQAGVAVPTGFAVTTDAYVAMLDETGLRAEIEAQLASTKFDDVLSLERSAQAIQIRCRSHKMPDAVDAAIRADYAAMGEDLPVAVRSSATAEDLPDASFAGQQDTYLWVVGADTVIEHIRDCWASLFTARAMKYRHDHDLGQIDVLMSVAVQKMVNAQTAGVAMTLDPLTGDRTRIVIDASYGLGELVVSGIVTPDNFTVEKILMEVIDRKISDKHVELVPDVVAKTTVEREVEAARRQAQCLTDAQVIAVAQLAKALERLNKCPQDVEWAFDADLPEGENLVALQSRPETVWSQKPAEPAKTSFSTGMMGMVGALNNPVGSKK